MNRIAAVLLAALTGAVMAVGIMVATTGVLMATPARSGPVLHYHPAPPTWIKISGFL